MADSAAKQLEAASWILDGSKNAPKVVYVFTDANCPYRHHFWQAARPWVESGKVQLRRIMVGVIRKDTAGKAAAIMTAPGPSAVLRQNELAAPGRGTDPLKAIPARIQRELEKRTVADDVPWISGDAGDRNARSGRRSAEGQWNAARGSDVRGSWASIARSTHYSYKASTTWGWRPSVSSRPVSCGSSLRLNGALAFLGSRVDRVRDRNR
ncbi:MAG: thiol:disulfide interchange protein DsbG [Stenotrophomonas sp.]